MTHYCKRPFDRPYFENYCSEGAYDDVFLYYSEVRNCIRMLSQAKWEIASVAVLGTATGKVLQEFDQAWNLKPYGCELSAWAYEKIPSTYRRRIHNCDLRDYLPWLRARRRKFDLVFSNSLFYLPKKDIDQVLEDLAAVTRLVHFHTAVQGDPWICIDEPYDWWQAKFAKHGFYRSSSASLWRRQLTA
mgnify:CR=1 FL=1